MSGASAGGRFEFGGKPNGRSRRQDERISVCKYCKAGIFRSQKWIWVHGDYTGLVHVECP